MDTDTTDTQVRHNQLFELIRQKHSADTTVARIRGHVIRKMTPSDFEELKKAAVRSLHTSQ